MIQECRNRLSKRLNIVLSMFRRRYMNESVVTIKTNNIHTIRICTLRLMRFIHPKKMERLTHLAFEPSAVKYVALRQKLNKI